MRTSQYARIDLYRSVSATSSFRLAMSSLQEAAACRADHLALSIDSSSSAERSRSRSRRRRCSHDPRHARWHGGADPVRGSRSRTGRPHTWHAGEEPPLFPSSFPMTGHGAYALTRADIGANFAVTGAKRCGSAIQAAPEGGGCK